MALNFSRLGQKEESKIKYNNIWASQVAIAQRKQLKNGMDDFTNFSWRGIDAFENFGAFIVNKNNLKFHTGATYSNQYTKPQFESSTGNLTGVSFNTPKVDFTIGAYWVSEDEYRQLIYWLNPYEISALTFDFEPNYYYQVKLAAVDQGTRHIVGIDKNYDKVCNTIQEIDTLKGTLPLNQQCRFKYIGLDIPQGEQYKEDLQGNRYYKNRVYQLSVINYPEEVNRILNITTIGHAIEKDYRYYTEFKVTFEIQGPSCAYHKMGYEFIRTESVNTSNTRYTAKWNIDPIVFHQIGNSDLEVPFIWNIPIKLDNIILISNNTTIPDNIYCHLIGSIAYEGDEKTLFDINLTNLSFLENDERQFILNLKYDSVSGLMFLELGNSEHILLSRISTVSTGKRIVDAIWSTKHFLTGSFESPTFDLSKVDLKLSIDFIQNNAMMTLVENPKPFGEEYATYIDMRARTNLI